MHTMQPYHGIIISHDAHSGEAVTVLRAFPDVIKMRIMCGLRLKIVFMRKQKTGNFLCF